jgi:hypothetical protein
VLQVFQLFGLRGIGKLALLHSDSFDDRAIAYIGDRYAAHGYNLAGDSGIYPARTGNGLGLSTGILDVPDVLTWESETTHQTLYVGIARQACLGAIVSIRYAGTPQIYASMNADQTISIIRYDAGANTVLASSSRTVPNAPDFYYCELMCKVDPTNGAYELRIDGVRWLSSSGINTSSTGDAFANQVNLTNQSHIADGSVTMVDDYYIADDDDRDGTASLVGFAGPVKIACLEETANGARVEFTPFAGSNYQNVDETSGEDADATYNSGGHNAADLYALTDLETPLVEIKAVAVHQFARKEDALFRSVFPVARVNGSDYPGTESELDASYQRVFYAWERNPATELPWDLSAVNSMQIGLLSNFS